MNVFHIEQMKNAKKKKMFVFAIFQGKMLIGYHNEKRVVKVYCNSCRDTNLQCKKIAFEELKKYNDYEDLYLIRFGKTYIQCGYDEYARDDYRTVLSELYLAKDVFLKIWETNRVNMNDKKKIRHALEILEEQIEIEETDVPSLMELKEIKSRMDEFRYHMSDFEKDEYGWNH